MTVRELRQKLFDLPQDFEVKMALNEEFDIAPVKRIRTDVAADANGMVVSRSRVVLIAGMIEE